VLFGGKCLGEEVRQVHSPSQMMDRELSLANSIAEPVEAHVNAFGTALFYCIRRQADDKFIVAEERSGRLLMAHLVGNRAKPDAVLSVEKRGAVLSFAS
jgi:hypothetical protein